MGITELQKLIINNRITQDELLKLYNNDYNDILHNDASMEYFIKYLKSIITSGIPDIEQAANIIKDACKNDKIIVCSVDIDCDGLCSGVVMYRMLTRYYGIPKSNIRLVIGTRTEGRGVNEYVMSRLDTIKEKCEKDIGLLITADHGTTDNKNYLIIKDKHPGIKIIVTDHHSIVQEDYPYNADAFINTQRSDATFDKTICGCVTVFLTLLYGIKEDVTPNDKTMKELLHYIGTSTIVDMMSMKSKINRVIVKTFLKYSLEYEDDNFKLLKKELKLPPILTQRDVAIYIGPLLNTANRSGAERIALSALAIEGNDDIKSENIKYLNEINKYRKQDTYMSVMNILNNPDINKYKHSITLFADTKYHINGQIASNISNLYRLPTVCFNKYPNNGIYYGSGRAGNVGVDILSILNTLNRYHPNIIQNAAGHKGACGCNIYADKVNDFRRLFNTYSKEHISKLDIPEVKEDTYIPHKDINIYTLAKVLECGPYGTDWSDPIFISDPFEVVEIIQIKNFYKIKLRMSDGYELNSFHFFNIQSKHGFTTMNLKEKLPIGSIVNVWFSLNVGHFRLDRSDIQLEIVDLCIKQGELPT